MRGFAWFGVMDELTWAESLRTVLEEQRGTRRFYSVHELVSLVKNHVPPLRNGFGLTPAQSAGRLVALRIADSFFTVAL